MIMRYVMNLTPQEKVVMSYVVLGFSDKEISQKMKIKYSTVRTYVDRAILKIGGRNRTNAAFKFLVLQSPDVYWQTIETLQEVL